MSYNTITGPTGALLQAWDDATRTYTDYRSGSAVSRPYTAQENADADARVAAETEAANESSLQSKARQALTTNAAFLNLASPTNAQTLAQVKALTRQNNALIRLLTRALDSTDGS